MVKRYRKPYSIRKKRYWWKSKWVWIAIATLLFAAGIVYGAIFSPLFLLERITIEGNRKILAQELESAALSLTEHRIFVLELKNILFVSPEHIQTQLLKQFPTLKEVQVQRKLLHELYIVVEERRQVATWCIAENCFAMDSMGVVFEEQERSDRIVFSKEEVGQTPVLGESVINSDLLSRIVQFIKQIQAFPLLSPAQVRAETVLLISEQRIVIRFSEGWDIYITPEEDFDWQRRKLELVLEEKVSSERREKLEYIDLRFGSQAFIKDKE